MKVMISHVVCSSLLLLAFAAPAAAGKDINMYLKSLLQNPLQQSDLQVAEIIVKLKPKVKVLDDESSLSPAELGWLSEAAQTPLRQLSVTRSGGQVLALPRSMPLGEAQGIIHRLRLQPNMLWAEIHTAPANGLVKPAAAAPGAKPEAVTRQLMVKLRDPAMAARSANNESLPQSELDRLSQYAGVPLRHVRPMSGGAFVLELPYHMPVSEAQAIADRLTADPGVKYAEPDRPLRLGSVPNDPYYSAGQQWDFHESVGGINLPDAWDLSTGLTNLVIAVIDTGILPHPDLAGRVLPGYDMISDISMANDGDSRDSNPTDPGDWVTWSEAYTLGCDAQNSSWHGTHVAGTIAAVANNGIGVSGVNWGSKVLPVRVLGKCGGTSSDIADGYRWAAGISVPGVPANPYPARVINLSLGLTYTPCTSLAQEVVDEVLTQGVVIVAAAGNDYGGAISFPANCNGVIAVTSNTRAGSKALYSNYGPEATVAAPGGDGTGSNDIFSTLNAGTTVAGSYIYGGLYGTSMAAPHVSGIVSLMLSVNPGLTPAQVKTALQASSRPFSIFTSCGSWLYPSCGTGIADATKAILASIPSGNEVDVRSYVPAANAAIGYNSFLRVINTGGAATPVTVGVIDGETGRVGPIGQLAASLPSNAAITYSAQQIEAALGASLPADKRPRIGVTATGPIEVQSFMSNPGGVVSQIADAMTGTSGYYVRSYVPAANAAIGYTSFIRVINVGTSPTDVWASAIDGDTGLAGASGKLASSLPAGAAVTYTAHQIEAAMGVALPAAQRPRILVWGSTLLEVQSFMSNPGGSVTQIGGAQDGNSVAVRSYVPAANAMAGYTSFIRVINADTQATPVGVALIDGDTGQISATGQLVSSLPTGAAITFTAQQIEAAIGVNIPAQSRPRILVTSGGADLRVQSFMSNPGGVVTQISGAQTGNSVDVRTFIPAANSAIGYTSFLRVINSGSAATPVSVAVINATTGSVGPARQLIAAIPAGGAVTFTAHQVEAALGTSLPADDRPRIRVTANGLIEVQSFMSNPGGEVTETVDAQ